MNISLSGRLRYVKDHELIDVDLSRAEPGFSGRSGPTPQLLNEDGDLSIRWAVDQLSIGSGSYNITLRFKPKEIAHMMKIAWSNRPLAELLEALK